MLQLFMGHVLELHCMKSLIYMFALSPTDASVVLTEDTDQFMIGQRVFVGGSKPGVISYIGETQFAAGDWAGVTLDETIGTV